MKSKILFLLIFLSSFGFSQSINDYGAVIVPTKFDFVKTENQYRLNTLTKFYLTKAGFVAFYANETISTGSNDRCSFLYVDVKEEKGFMITKLYVTFKDCYGTVIYRSEVGKSREKEYELSYPESLNNAFVSVYALHYKYNGNTTNSQNAAIAFPEIVPVAVPAVATTTVGVIVSTGSDLDSTALFAQPIKNGFQLVDSTPKVVMKVYKTTNSSLYIASKGDSQGVMILKENQWFFEHYEKEILMSEKIAVKF